MPLGSLIGGGGRGLGDADVTLRTNLGQFRKDMTEAQRVYQQSTGAMSDSALRMAVAQEKLDRAIAKYGPESLQAKQATVGLRQEMDRLATTARKADAAIDSVDATTVRGRRSAAGLTAGWGAATRAAGVFGLSLGGTYGLVSAIRTSVSAASDLEEQTNKVAEVFGSSGDEIVRWSRTTGNALGIAQDRALEAAGTFGNLLNTVGLAPQKAAAMSQALVRLAADLASFNNASPDETLDAIRSGLIGEAEPLRRYGVLLSEARVKQEAMAATGKRTVASLTDQEKALARYRLILKDTTPAQGDFARTSTGAANANRRLSANVRDLEANLGKLLVPSLARGADSANTFTVGIIKAIDAVKGLGNAISGGGPADNGLVLDPSSLGPGERPRFIPTPTRITGPDEGSRGPSPLRTPRPRPPNRGSGGNGLTRVQGLTLAVQRAELSKGLSDDLEAGRNLLSYYEGIASNTRLKGDKLFQAKQEVLQQEQRVQSIEDSIAQERQAAADKAEERRKAAREKLQKQQQAQTDRLNTAAETNVDRINRALREGKSGPQLVAELKRRHAKTAGATGATDEQSILTDELGKLFRQFLTDFTNLQRDRSNIAGGSSMSTIVLEQLTREQTGVIRGAFGRPGPRARPVDDAEFA